MVGIKGVVVQKKILYISQMYPYPPDGGGKIKTFQTLWALAQEYEVFAVFVSETQPTRDEPHELEKLGIKVKVFYSDRILASVKDDFIDLFWHFLHGTPHYVFQYTHQAAFPYIQNLIGGFNPDVIHVDHLNMAQYLPKEKHEAWILEHHNVETYLYWTRFLYSRKFTRKLYLLIEMILTFFYEWKTLRLFDHVFAISTAEEARLRKIFRIFNVSTQPLVYPAHHIRRKPAEHPYILFIGNLGWPPNEDAVEWFLRDIFPLVLREVPSAEFHVVGKRQPRYEKNWSMLSGVFLHGYQKSLDPFLSQADVFVLPFQMGGGMRIKSLTAMAASIPIVSTPLGIEGLSVKNGQECIVARKSEEFTSHVINVITNKSLRKYLSDNAQRYVSRFHGSDENNRFLTKYQEVTQKFL